MTDFIAVLDACVLYNAGVRDALLVQAESPLAQAVYSRTASRLELLDSLKKAIPTYTGVCKNSFRIQALNAQPYLAVLA